MTAESLAVLIPARNEESTIAAVVKSVQAYVRHCAKNSEIFVVADRCTDQTRSRAESAGAIVIETDDTCRGLGDVYRIGMSAVLATDAEIIVQIDADGQYDASQIPSLCEVVLHGGDLAILNRLATRPSCMTRRRYVLNRAASHSIGLVLGQRTPDTQSGLRALRRRVALLQTSIPHTYTQEQIVKAVSEQLDIQYVPGEFYKRPYGRSRVARWSLLYAAKVIPGISQRLVRHLYYRKVGSCQSKRFRISARVAGES